MFERRVVHHRDERAIVIVIAECRSPLERRRQERSRVLHAERLEEARLEERLVGLPRHLFHDERRQQEVVVHVLERRARRSLPTDGGDAGEHPQLLRLERGGAADPDGPELPRRARQTILAHFAYGITETFVSDVDGTLTSSENIEYAAWAARFAWARCA